MSPRRALRIYEDLLRNSDTQVDDLQLIHTIMIGTRQCRKCHKEMAVVGQQGHLRCPHCQCWLPTSESWTPIWITALGILIIWWIFG